MRDLIKKRNDILELGKKLKSNIYHQIRLLTPSQILGFIQYFKNVSFASLKLVL